MLISDAETVYEELASRKRGSILENEYKEILYRCALLLLGVSPALTEEESITVTVMTDSRRPTRVRSAGSSK